jgi:hypothetical protein
MGHAPLALGAIKLNIKGLSDMDKEWFYEDVKK